MQTHWCGMNKLTKLIGFVILFMWMSPQTTILFGQSTDYESRLGAVLKADLTQKSSFSFNLEQRFGPDFISFKRLLAEPEITYSPIKSFDISLTYRIGFQKEEANYFFHHRWSPALSYSRQYGDWRIKFTTTAQYSSPDFDELHSLEHLVLRNKLGLRYSIFGSRFRPELRAELFSGQQNGRFLNHQIRFMALSAFRLTRHSALEFYLQYDKEYNVPRPDKSLALGLSYSHQLNFQ